MSEARITNLSNESNTGGPTISGITTFSGTNYFVPPVGDTASRPDNPQKGSIRFNTDTKHLEYYRGDAIGWVEVEASNEELNGGNRGLIMGGIISGRSNVVDYVTISTCGNVTTFGDLVATASQGAGLASRTRGVAGGGTPSTPSGTNNIDFCTISSTGDFADFGDMTTTGFEKTACSSQTRGVFFGASVAPNQGNTIEYITIAATGNSVDFGDMRGTCAEASVAGSSTRGVTIGGRYTSPAYENTMDYVTIATTGNSQDFGDITGGKAGNTRGGNCGSATRGVFLTNTTGSDAQNTIEYVTIATLGNSVDFGDRTVARTQVAQFGSTVRGVFAGAGEGDTDVIDYVQIATTGNAVDFGNLQSNYGYAVGCSNGHGGL